MALLSHPVRSYWRHLWTAGTRHDVHSPFVYDLTTKALRTRTPRTRFADVEQLRKSLLGSHEAITITDLGAGSRKGGSRQRTVRSIASTALKPRRQAEQLARIAAHFTPATMLELGTSLGITTLYLARAVPAAQVHTIEGCPATAALAASSFAAMNAGNIIPHTGSFADRLPHVLATMDRLDLAYIDGHHRADPTLSYFEQCLSRSHNGTVFIFDDIHWSTDMEDAWERIKQHPQVTVTVDLFHYGLVFIRQEQQREHFRLRY